MVTFKENKLNNDIKINTDSIATIIFVIFYSMPFFKWAVENLFELIGIQNIANIVILTLLYSCVLILCKINSKYIIVDFLFLLVGIISFFIITYTLHPEYNYVYFRADYGVLNYVLRPDNGIYAYLFVRMLNDPKNLHKGLTISSFITFFYSIILFYFSMKRGYWIGENYLGEVAKYSYDLNFGYNLVLPTCTFIYNGLHENKKFQLVMAIISLGMILIAGSRGPLLSIIIFALLYNIVNNIRSRNKIRSIIICFSVLLIIFITYNELDTIKIYLDNAGISSRTISKILENDISDVNGRDILWEAAINHIKRNPLGSGAMGARNILYRIHYVGHPHNLFLEIFIDYGLVIGSFIILKMILETTRILFLDENSDWSWIYLLFLAQACTLLTSYTYWHSNAIWGLLAVIICNKLTKKYFLKRGKNGK